MDVNVDVDAEWADDERAVELTSIAAIYPEIVIDPKFPFKASLSLPVTPLDPAVVVFEDSKDANINIPTTSSPMDNVNRENGLENSLHGGAVVVQTYPISHFPPLELQIELPERYPAIEPPKITISTYPDWLPGPTISRLVTEGKNLWEECGKDLVVYSYIDHLQQAAETIFGLLTVGRDKPLSFPESLKIPLLDFDLRVKREKFEQETFVCGICLEPKKGKVCHRLPRCSHVFCVACLQDFYNTCIAEGDVDNVKCIDPNCGKETKSAPADEDIEGQRRPRRHRKPDLALTPDELLQIPLEPQIVQRYALLKRKLKLEADKSVIYCPRQWCQGAARSKRFPKPADPLNISNLELSDDEDVAETFDPFGPEDQLPPMEERVAICEDCGYAFCRVCKRGWHGPSVFCYPRRAAELTAEEKATEDYMQLYTTRCPTCDFRCQKAMGCNHMICSRCKTHFCYLCSSWLFAANPYQHFNERSSSCYMKLWELERGDGTGDPAQEQLADPFWAEEPDDEEDEEHGAWQFALALNDANHHRPPPAAPDPPHPGPPRAIPPPPRQQQQEQPPQRIEMDQREPRPAGQTQNDIGVPPPPQNHAQVQDQGQRQQRQQPPAADLGQRRGLQRFLYLVQHDQEDEWDSDELDDDF
ncbi:translation termination inhibitor protein itt1 [Coccidioides posadasii str. Silveira]|uniref:RBR-type E3 ubiquitin transferase n=3 Tax=Coccidioides posadasii TaxID=199306 RepID=E9D362_COCPS|nr:RWD domain containing protein [Coccidioides posadasii C735 delta SOWgp]EER29968.1 RWD domain containing protein [Coccidioides posadasii C735 delta SOWgp]EFW19057.1 RING finger protein [Coccidioides posadasii str. Silveira]KMM71401.1 ring finger protein 14 [Coccidioides posadasii RMSCC 3488]QVM12623.1 translation termination inhibitor protein itt1 [Coccidioides posadasii str. Silveira]|eukprot:XP_003072113.1 RWD domain containing protein [Coccidioides posadasii C735 delta SOWgp]